MLLKIPFNKPSIIGRELGYIAKAVFSGKISGDCIFTKKCHTFMESKRVFHNPKTGRPWVDDAQIRRSCWQNSSLGKR